MPDCARLSGWNSGQNRLLPTGFLSCGRDSAGKQVGKDTSCWVRRVGRCSEIHGHDRKSGLITL